MYVCMHVFMYVSAYVHTHVIIKNQVHNYYHHYAPVISNALMAKKQVRTVLKHYKMFNKAFV